MQAVTQVPFATGSSGSSCRGLLSVVGGDTPDSRCMTARNVQLKVMAIWRLTKHKIVSMSKTSHANTTVAVVCNPTSNKGMAPKRAVVIDLLRGAGRAWLRRNSMWTGNKLDDSPG